MEIIFKYFWVFLIILIWLIWGYFSAINIIAYFKREHSPSLDDMYFEIEDYAIMWVNVTIGVSALASFVYFISKI